MKYVKIPVMKSTRIILDELVKREGYKDYDGLFWYYFGNLKIKEEKE